MPKRPNHITKGSNNQLPTLRVVELFAGVGGFRIGLERASARSTHQKFKTIWSNQWEPSTKRQHASEVYAARFGADGHSNDDIAKIATHTIPTHDLLVGGFPCQDYSVARTLSHATGLQGKKGVLWWEIHRILREKGSNAPSYIFLENVDRLVKSPSSARGRDFAIMLSSLAQLGYSVEWRVINAADYGKPQRRKRIYILGYKKGTGLDQALRKTSRSDWLLNTGVFATGFKVSSMDIETKYEVGTDPVQISSKFSQLFPDDISFFDSGMMLDGKIWTMKTKAEYGGRRILLKDILTDEENVPAEYFIKKSELKIWKYLKGAKKELRTAKNGFEYEYTEGPVIFPDRLEHPSRTIVTGEGGATPSRFKHVIVTESGRYRRLLPVELELLSQFPANHTALEGISDAKRAFFIGNALVVSVIEDIGKALSRAIKKYGQDAAQLKRPAQQGRALSHTPR